MACNILKGIAVAGGTGVAIGYGSKRRSQAPSMSDTLDITLAIDPLLDRLDRIEARMSAVEARPVSDAGSVSLAALDQLVQRQNHDIEALRTQVERRFAEVASEVPAILESLLGPRVEDLRARLHAEMRESLQATLSTFEQTLDNKVSVRTSALEKALVDQSTTLRALSQRALEAEEHFHRLISAVERLCERKERSVLDRPVERQLTEAFQRQPVPSALPPDSGFRPRIVKDEGDKPRHRNKMASL